MSLKTLTSTLLAALALTSPAYAWQEGAGYLELADRLDRPEDGYCIDLPGSGDWVDFSMPLTAHNCKLPGLYADEAVSFTSPGPIVFPAYDGCVTATGINGGSLPGASIILRPCATDLEGPTPFISESLQNFTHRADSRIELTGSSLCLTAGPASSSTMSPTHRWRTLTLQNCATAEPSLSIWKPFTARAQQ